MVVVLHQGEATELAGAEGTGDQLWIRSGDVERASGWSWQGDRLRKGDVAVAIPAGEADAFTRAGGINLAAFWRQMGRPLLASDAGDVWVLGTAAEERAAALRSLQAPDFTLPDLDGNRHALSDFRGRKVYLASWASW